jgi:hypothetical protein
MPKWLLLDPYLFGNLNNLVNKNNPFGKYICVEGDDMHEMMCGRLNNELYDMMINDPKTEFLLPWDMYVNQMEK